jgi:hypothetical protein
MQTRLLRIRRELNGYVHLPATRESLLTFGLQVGLIADDHIWEMSIATAKTA